MTNFTARLYQATLETKQIAMTNKDTTLAMVTDDLTALSNHLHGLPRWKKFILNRIL